MRKLFVAVAALGMLLTSCAKDADVVTGGNESLVSFKVSQPKLGTRAATGSHDATQTYGTGVAAEDLQYAIFEVKGNENQYRFDRDKAGFFEGETLEGTLTERLVNGKTYIAVFWADAAMDKYYTVDWENGTISFVDATKLNAQDENLDAFYGMTAPFKVEGPSTVTAELRRPFAQLNISTCDTSEAAEAGLTVETSYIEVSKVYTAFNFWNGEVDANSEVAVTFAETSIPKTYIYTIDGTAYDVLSMNYLLVDEKKNVDVKFHYASTDQEFESEFTSVPVQRNYRTHIVGNLLTDATDFNIIIKPEFDGEHIHDVDLINTFKYGGTVELTRDVVLSAPLEMLNDVETTINLNGHSITYANPDEDAYTAVFMVKKGTLTIEGEGDVVAEGVGNIAVWAGRGDAENDGKVIIKGGNFSNTTSQELIYTNNKGIIEIYGGTFQVAEEDDKSFAAPQYPVLNLYGNGKTGNDIIVYGGTFYNFNPADNVSENPKKNFVAGGYASIASTDAEGNNIYTVVEAKDMEGLTVAALGYQNAKLSWTAVDGADHYKVSYGTWTSDKITGEEYVDMPAETVKDSRKPVFQVVAYDANGSTLAMGKTAGDVEIFTLFERPVPEVRLANGVLTVATDVDYTKMGNAHLYGVMLAAEVYFYKDGAATPAYTAKATAADQAGVNKNYATAANKDKKMKGSNMVMALTTWQWAEGTGAFGSATNVAPAFEPGTYTMAIKGHYFPTVGAYYSVSAGGNLAFNSADRIVFAGIIMPNATDGDINATLNGAILREDAIEGSFSIASVEGIAAARNGYKGIEVTWSTVQGATSYEVVADGQKVTVTEAKAQFTAADTQHAFTNFSVTALDANGAIVAVGNLAAETKVWNINGVQPLAYTFDGSNLVVKNATNLIGTAVHMKVEFVKDGTVVHTAEMDKAWESTTGHGGAGGYNMNSVLKNKQNTADGLWYGRFTNGLFADFPGATAAGNNLKWAWNGTTPCDAPAFEPGDYTVNYTAYYYPIVNGFWSASSSNFDRNQGSGDRVMFVTEDCLVEKIEVKGSFDNYVVGFNAEAKAWVDAVELTWNPVGSSTYEIYVDGTQVGETAETSYTYKNEGAKTYNFEIKVKGSTVSATASATVEFTMAGWQAPVVTFNKQADGKYMVLVKNMLTLNYGYYGGTITMKDQGGNVVYTFVHDFGETPWKWACWRRFFYSDFERKHWKLNGSSSEAESHTLAAGTYTVEYSIDYMAFKNAVYSTGSSDYGAVIKTATVDTATAISCDVDGGVDGVCWTSRGVSSGYNGGVNAAGAKPYTVNKQGTFTGTYTIE